MGEFADLLLAGARARDALEWLLAEARWWAEEWAEGSVPEMVFPWQARNGEQAHD